MVVRMYVYADMWSILRDDNENPVAVDARITANPQEVRDAGSVRYWAFGDDNKRYRVALDGPEVVACRDELYNALPMAWHSGDSRND